MTAQNEKRNNFFHSISLVAESCKGCINCLKRCPTEAIRVRKGKSRIIKEYCTDCGACIRFCPHHAKKATYDSLESMADYEYKIALPPPELYAQFNNLEDKALVLNALLSFGFDDVYEVAAAAELVSEITRKLLKEADISQREGERTPLPVISSACPSVMRLIRVKFPNLVENISPVVSPAEMAANAAVKLAMLRTRLPREKIGVFFITPCPAKVTEIYAPLGVKKSQIDKAIALKDIYPKLLPIMKKIAEDENGDEKFPEEINKAGRIGVSWGCHGGEAGGLLTDNYLAVDGIENVIKALEDLEDSKFKDLEFIELNACSGGCVGGVLAVENPYMAKVKLNILRKYLPVSGTRIDEAVPPYAYHDEKIEFLPVYRLGETFEESIVLMNKVDELVKQFPGLDCGCCGAPTCRAHSEDVARGSANERDCIHIMRDYINNAEELKTHEG
jgi:iron only hydrogenase large subunit-like protein